MKLPHVTGFLTASLALVGLLAFAVVSVDRSTIEHLAIVGELTPEQLASLKTHFDGVAPSEARPEDIRRRVADLEWVHHVNARKRWPSGLDLEVHAQEAIAYWNDHGFINEEGGALYSNLIPAGDLPHLYGPVGSEREVMEKYQQFSGMLNGYGHEIRTLAFTERGSWSIETEAGVEVLLGKENLKARMQRFLVVSDRLRPESEAREVRRMDARYADGVAVAFSDNNEMKLAEANNNAREQNL